ncbi:hypothetical protein [Clavibacter michiganensis]|uniref:hypothetical protein n=1 Tax=Clavibacter michiganensis TaxID=28447 RepID=UPI0011AFD665|nr:hypothetical protein [Clavibacter michiganensis]
MVTETEDDDVFELPTSRDEQLALLADAVLGVATTATMVTLPWLGSPPHEGSAAAGVLQQQPHWERPALSPAPLAESLRNINLALLSGHDHLHTLGGHLSTPHFLATSFFTVMRGALEAYARAYFLLGNEDPKSIMTAFLASRHVVLKYAEKDPKDDEGNTYETPLSKRSKAFMAIVKEAAVAWDIPSITMDSITNDVHNVLTAYAAASGDDIHDTLYSDLSQPAHTHTVGYRFLITPNGPGEDAAVIGLKVELANRFVQILLGVQTMIMHKYLTFVGVRADEVQDWREQCLRADEIQDALHDAAQEQQKAQGEGKPA